MNSTTNFPLIGDVFNSMPTENDALALPPHIFETVARAVAEHFGTDVQFDFSVTDALELALAKYYKSNDDNFLSSVTNALANLARDNFDQVEGGFFRVMNTRAVKRLEDNARLLSLCLHMYQITERESFRDVSRKTVDFINAMLYDEDGGYFYSHQEAAQDYFTRSKAARAESAAPNVDQILYSDANALMASAYFEAAHILDDPSLQSKATSVIGTLGGELFESGQGIYHLRKSDTNELQQPGHLADQAYTILAFTDAYQASARPTYLPRARILAEFALEYLFDQEQGGFFGDLSASDKPLMENAVMADALTRLYHFTGEEKYREAARRTLIFFATALDINSSASARYAFAVEHWLNLPLHITIVGEANGTDTRDLLDAALKQYASAKVIEVLDPSRDAVRLTLLGYPPPSDGAQAYICVGQACLPPVREPQQIAASIARVMRK